VKISKKSASLSGNATVNQLVVEGIANTTIALQLSSANTLTTFGDGDVDGRDFLVWQRNSSIGNLAD
jgi:hypothetical protein